MLIWMSDVICECTVAKWILNWKKRRHTKMISKLQKFQSRGLHAVIHQIITEQMQTFLPSLIQPAKFKSLMRERLTESSTHCMSEGQHPQDGEPSPWTNFLECVWARRGHGMEHPFGIVKKKKKAAIEILTRISSLCIYYTSSLVLIAFGTVFYLSGVLS